MLSAETWFLSSTPRLLQSAKAPIDDHGLKAKRVPHNQRDWIGPDLAVQVCLLECCLRRVTQIAIGKRIENPYRVLGAMISAI